MGRAFPTPVKRALLVMRLSIIILFSLLATQASAWTPSDAALDIPQEVDVEQRIRPDPNNCNVYYYLKVPLTCGEGNAFNKASLRCDSLENVAKFDSSCGEGGEGGSNDRRGGGSSSLSRGGSGVSSSRGSGGSSRGGSGVSSSRGGGSQSSARGGSSRGGSSRGGSSRGASQSSSRGGSQSSKRGGSGSSSSRGSSQGGKSRGGSQTSFRGGSSRGGSSQQQAGGNSGFGGGNIGSQRGGGSRA